MSQTQGVWVLAHGHPPSQTKTVQKGSATVPVAVFGVAPKTRQQTDLSNDGSGATPEPAGETPALPPKRPSQNDFGTAFVPSAVGAAYL